jgi:hypothetical protein
MAEWAVYRVNTIQPQTEPHLLGTVKAPNQPAALLQAFKQWPHEIDPRQLQGGFSVRKISFN